MSWRRIADWIHYQVSVAKTAYKNWGQKLGVSRERSRRCIEPTAWQRGIGCLIFVSLFSKKSPMVGGSFVERDMQLKAFNASSPLYHIMRCHPPHRNKHTRTHTHTHAIYTSTPKHTHTHTHAHTCKCVHMLSRALSFSRQSVCVLRTEEMHNLKNSVATFLFFPLSLSLSLSLCRSLSRSFFLSLAFYLLLSLSFYLCLSVSPFLSFSLCFSHSVSLSLSLARSRSRSLAFSLFLSLSFSFSCLLLSLSLSHFLSLAFVRSSFLCHSLSLPLSPPSSFLFRSLSLSRSLSRTQTHKAVWMRHTN